MGYEPEKTGMDLDSSLNCLTHRRRRDTSDIGKSRNTRTNGNTQRELMLRTLHHYRSAWGLAVCVLPSPAPSIAQMTVA